MLAAPSVIWGKTIQRFSETRMLTMGHKPSFAKSAFCALPSLARTAAPGNFGLEAVIHCGLDEWLLLIL
ncbi:hypothetical protein [Ruegeria arenilitoris]|uniref:hypothetical protein n=1 Tax=Ruegeria arenilitoris TaxID=1173585 RepID=UPI00147EAD21|nr:hypothetical protein [Ruegeria arenilitoris]